MSELAQRLDDGNRKTSPPASSGDPVRALAYARQRRVRRAGRAYSRFVSVMKWLLPSLAIGLAGLVVIWPELKGAPIPPRGDMPQGEMGAGEMANPRFGGTDSRNRPYSVTGVSAQPHPQREQIVIIEQPEAEITLEGGTWLALIAERGLLDNEEGTIRLEGGVDVFRDDGYTFASDEVEIDLRTRRAWGDAPVSAHGPYGEIAAAGFRIEDGGRRIAFVGPSRLLMRGANGGESAP